METKWTRSKDDILIGGVLGGLAKYLSIDPTTIRLIFLLLWVFSGVPLALVYIFLWVILPEENTDSYN